MPYDPRPISQGGNRGIDEAFSRKALPGMFRVIGVDTFDGTDWIEEDFQEIGNARIYADLKVQGKQMLVMHIYDDLGTHRYNVGEF